MEHVARPRGVYARDDKTRRVNEFSGLAGKRAVRSRRRSAARLTVSGTVIGVLESVLSQQRLTLGASAHGASRARNARSG